MDPVESVETGGEVMTRRVPRLADTQGCLSFVDMVEIALRQHSEPEAVRSALSGVADYIADLESEVCRLQRAAGIDPQWRSRDDTIEEIETGISEIHAAFQRKDHKTCEQWRIRLEQMGVTLEDYPTGTRWRRGSASPRRVEKPNEVLPHQN